MEQIAAIWKHHGCYSHTSTLKFIYYSLHTGTDAETVSWYRCRILSKYWCGQNVGGKPLALCASFWTPWRKAETYVTVCSNQSSQIRVIQLGDRHVALPIYPHAYWINTVNWCERSNLIWLWCHIATLASVIHFAAATMYLLAATFVSYEVSVFLFDMIWKYSRTESLFFSIGSMKKALYFPLTVLICINKPLNTSKHKLTSFSWKKIFTLFTKSAFPFTGYNSNKKKFHSLKKIQKSPGSSLWLQSRAVRLAGTPKVASSS